MSKDSANIQSELLPDRYPQTDLFICDVADAILKDIMPQMEHPFYSLSKKPDTTIRRYEHGDKWLEIVPTVKGAATIYDKDILIFAISQIMAKLNRGEKVSQRVRINSVDLLRFTNRGISGRDYMALQDALDRLDGTRIRTNIRTGDEEEWHAFGLIDAAATRRKNGLDGRLLWCELKLSDWVFDAIQNDAVLTLNRDYFRLRKPIERRLYEIARKHCGQQKEWRISLELLHKKTGSRSSLKEFKRILLKGNTKKQDEQSLIESNHLPDYTIEFDDKTDKVLFRNRKKWWEDKKPPEAKPFIRNVDTYDKALAYIPSNQTVKDWESDWVNHWIDTGCPPLKDADKAFLGFCKNRYASMKQRM